MPITFRRALYLPILSLSLITVALGQSQTATKDFAAFTAPELADAAAALSTLIWTPGERRTRRWVPGRGARIDLRRAIGDSLRTEGDVIALRRRRRR